MEDYNPSTDISANLPSFQHVLKGIHNDNDGGLVKKNVMKELLDNMHCYQINLLNMRIV
jgi:hypothetical protein